MLPAEDFKFIVSSTPLISIDLIVRQPDGRVLLGKRLNKPVQGYWFVPGGRILKNERIDMAFARLTEAELGTRIDINTAEYLGLYEHFYEDSALSDDVSTHYVVNAFLINLTQNIKGITARTAQ